MIWGWKKEGQTAATWGVISTSKQPQIYSHRHLSQNASPIVRKCVVGSGFFVFGFFGGISLRSNAESREPEHTP